MTNLQSKLNQILADKQINLLPENLKKGITCLGVEGKLDPTPKINKVIDLSLIMPEPYDKKPVVKETFNGTWTAYDIHDILVWEYLDPTTLEDGIFVSTVISDNEAEIQLVIPNEKLMEQDTYDTCLQLCKEIQGPIKEVHTYSSMIDTASNILGDTIEDDQAEVLDDDDERMLQKSLKVKRGGI